MNRVETFFLIDSLLFGKKQVEHIFIFFSKLRIFFAILCGEEGSDKPSRKIRENVKTVMRDPDEMNI